MKEWMERHEHWLNKINEIDIDQAASFHLAKMEYYYFQAQVCAYHVAGYCRKAQRFYEGRAEQEQANRYEEVRNDTGKTATDGQYLSRKAKGEMLIKAAGYEGDYVRWLGIAQSYENAINSIKDMIKSIDKEHNGRV